MNRKTFLFGLLFLVLFGVIRYSNTEGVESNSHLSSDAVRLENASPSAPAEEKSGEVVFMKAKKWTFDPPTVQVRFGTTILLQIESVDVASAWVMPAFGVEAILSPGEVTSVEITPDRPGAYVFFYSNYPVVKGVLTVQ